MNKLTFSVDIKAPKEKVWQTLWDDATFRDWASIIDEGTYMKGELREGNEVEFISSVNGYGVTSYVEKLTPNEFILFKHMKDTKDAGTAEREKDWTGTSESYTLIEKDGITTLTIESELPLEQEEYFKENLPKALERIKQLARK